MQLYRSMLKSGSDSDSVHVQVTKDIQEKMHLKKGFEGGERGCIAYMQSIDWHSMLLLTPQQGAIEMQNMKGSDRREKKTYTEKVAIVNILLSSLQKSKAPVWSYQHTQHLECLPALTGKDCKRNGTECYKTKSCLYVTLQAHLSQRED